MASIDRNADCPCGSGNKYKRCCGAPGAEDVVEKEARSLLGALDELADFAEREEFLDEWNLAYDHFWGDWEDVLTDDELEELNDDPLISSQFVLGLTVDTTFGDGRTILDAFLERCGDRLTTAARTSLTTLRDTHPDLYRILGVDPSGHMVFESALSATRYEVEVPQGAEALPGTLLVARLYPLSPSLHTIVAGTYDFAGEGEAQLLERLAQDRRAVEGVAGKMDDVQFLRHMSLRFHGMWLEHRIGDHSEPDLPHVWYEVESYSGLVRALDECDEIRSAGDDCWLFGEGRDGRPPTELVIEEGDLVVIGESEDEVEAAASLLERAAGDAVRRAEVEDVPLDPRDFGVEEEL